MELAIVVDLTDREHFEKIVDDLTNMFYLLHGEEEHTGTVTVIDEPASGIGSTTEVGEEENYPDIPAPPASLADSVTDAADLDSEGLPWDARIHTEKKTKVKKNNTWKLKRGVDAALVVQVKEELRTFMAADHTPDPSADHIEPNAAHVFGQPSTNSIPTPPVEEVEPAGNAVTFPDLIKKTTARIADSTHGVIFKTNLDAVLKNHDVPSIPMIAAKPQLVPVIDQELETVWNSLNTQS